MHEYLEQLVKRSPSDETYYFLPRLGAVSLGLKFELGDPSPFPQINIGIPDDLEPLTPFDIQSKGSYFDRFTRFPLSGNSLLVQRSLETVTPWRKNLVQPPLRISRNYTLVHGIELGSEIPRGYVFQFEMDLGGNLLNEEYGSYEVGEKVSLYFLLHDLLTERDEKLIVVQGDFPIRHYLSQRENVRLVVENYQREVGINLF